MLGAVDRGDAQHANELLPLVYDELRRLAASRIAREAPGQTLQATALVHEAWLRLSASESRQWNGRAHFFGAAAETMRRVLVDRARRRMALKRGEGKEKLDFEELEIAAPAEDDRLLALDDALGRFSELDPKKAELVKLRYFAGMTLEEVAEVLGISLPTANRWWAFSRAWLLAQLKGEARTGI